MSKKKWFKRDEEPALLLQKTKHVLLNKYFNTFMNSMEWEGLEDEQEDYIMRKLWCEGSIAAFDITGADMLGFAPYATITYTMYDTPSTVNLINERNVPFIPNKIMNVNKDVVLGYYQRNHKPVYEIVNYYIDRMAQVEMVINTNLQVHKLPLLVSLSENDIDKANNVIKQILNNEVVIFMDAEELNMVKAVANGAPYIIDKLYGYKNNLESELLTYLGVDNSQIDVDKLAVDQINANNAMINGNAEGYEKELNKFCKRVKEVLGYDISVKTTHKPAQSVHETIDYDGKIDVDKNETGGTL